jgi:hypothetical protein
MCSTTVPVYHSPQYSIEYIKIYLYVFKKQERLNIETWKKIEYKISHINCNVQLIWQSCESETPAKIVNILVWLVVIVYDE